MFSKDKIVDHLSPSALKGKQGKGSLLCESQQIHLHVIDQKAENLVFERTRPRNLVDCHVLIDEDFVLHSGTKHFSIDEHVVGKIFDKVRRN